MRLTTTTGLHGDVIAYRQTGITDSGDRYGVVLIEHEPGVFSTNELVYRPNGPAAMYGHYDMNREQAEQDFESRVRGA
jgi:hypothetical protein